MFTIKRNWVLLVLVLFLAALFGGMLNYDEISAQTRARRNKIPAGEEKSYAYTGLIDCCSHCHQSYVDSMTKETLLGGKHGNAVDDCFDCHDQPALDMAHAEANKPPRKLFRQRKYPNDYCFACHEGYDELVKMTAKSHLLETTDGKFINPHDTHVGQVECFNCHKIHKNKPSIEYCYGCHHTRELRNCKNCHNSAPVE